MRTQSDSFAPSSILDLHNATLVEHGHDPADFPVGTVAELEAMHERLPFELLYIWARPAGLPIEESSHSLERFARPFIPHFTANDGNRPDHVDSDSKK